MAKTRLQKRGSTKPNDKQTRFIEEYCVDYNGARAARAAGYANPKQQARKFLNGYDYPEVTKAIGALRQKQIDAIAINREEVLHDLLVLFRANPADLVDENGYMVDNLHDLPLGLQKAINGIKIKRHYDKQGEVVAEDVELKLIPRDKIMEMVNKVLGLYQESQEVPIVNLNQTISFNDLYEQALLRANTDPVEERIDTVLEGKVTKKVTKPKTTRKKK